jgi:glycosyltransferase involved in cell wall biosynthesis
VSAGGPGVPLRVGVNLLWLVPGLVGGSEDYLVGLLGQLAAEPPAGVEVTLFVLQPFPAAHPDLAGAFETVVCDLSGRRKELRVLAESTWLAVQARRRGIEVMYHAGGTIPPVRVGAPVVLVHDLQPLVFPEHFSLPKRLYLRRRLKPSVTRSAAIVSLSHWIGTEVVDRLGAEPARVFEAPPQPQPGEPLDPATAEALDVDGPFFLYPAITYPHKNHRVLVEAFAGVVEAHPEARLVLTGGEAGAETELRALVERLGLGERVRRPGRVPRAQLAWLYANAVALTYPSRFEGFGLPLLEAMGHGCPVIAADSTAMPEVVGEAGLLVPPDQPRRWTAVMTELLERADRRAELAEAGRRRAATTSWARSAAETVAAWRFAAGRARAALPDDAREAGRP